MPEIATSSLRTIGHLASGSDIQTQIVINCMVLANLRVLLTSGKVSTHTSECLCAHACRTCPSFASSALSCRISPPAPSSRSRHARPL